MADDVLNILVKLTGQYKQIEAITSGKPINLNLNVKLGKQFEQLASFQEKGINIKVKFSFDSNFKKLTDLQSKGITIKQNVSKNNQPQNSGQGGGLRELNKLIQQGAAPNPNSGQQKDRVDTRENVDRQLKALFQAQLNRSPQLASDIQSRNAATNKALEAKLKQEQQVRQVQQKIQAKAIEDRNQGIQSRNLLQNKALDLQLQQDNNVRRAQEKDSQDAAIRARQSQVARAKLERSNFRDSATLRRANEEFRLGSVFGNEDEQKSTIALRNGILPSQITSTRAKALLGGFDRLKNPDNLREIAFAGLFGKGLLGKAAGIAGGAIGASTGLPGGALIGSTIAGVGADIATDAFEKLTESLKTVAEAGLKFEQAVTAIAASLQQSTNLTDANGNALSIKDQVAFNQQRAEEIQAAGQKSAAPLGVGSDLLNTGLRSVASTVGTRANLKSQTQADLTTGLLAFVRTTAPDLEGSPIRAGRDLRDVLRNRAKNTELAAADPALLQQLGNIHTEEDAQKAIEALKGYVDVVLNSGKAANYAATVGGEFNNLLQNTGKIFLDQLTPALKSLSQVLTSADLEKGLEFLAKFIGTIANDLGEAASGFASGFLSAAHDLIDILNTDINSDQFEKGSQLVSAGFNILGKAIGFLSGIQFKAISEGIKLVANALHFLSGGITPTLEESLAQLKSSTPKKKSTDDVTVTQKPSLVLDELFQSIGTDNVSQNLEARVKKLPQFQKATLDKIGQFLDSQNKKVRDSLQDYFLELYKQEFENADDLLKDQNRRSDSGTFGGRNQILSNRLDALNIQDLAASDQESLTSTALQKELDKGKKADPNEVLRLTALNDQAKGNQAQVGVGRQALTRDTISTQLDQVTSSKKLSDALNQLSRSAQENDFKFKDLTLSLSTAQQNLDNFSSHVKEAFASREEQLLNSAKDAQSKGVDIGGVLGALINDPEALKQASAEAAATNLNNLAEQSGIGRPAAEGNSVPFLPRGGSQFANGLDQEQNKLQETVFNLSNQVSDASENFRNLNDILKLTIAGLQQLFNPTQTKSPTNAVISPQFGVPSGQPLGSSSAYNPGNVPPGSTFGNGPGQLPAGVSQGVGPFGKTVLPPQPGLTFLPQPNTQEELAKLKDFQKEQYFAGKPITSEPILSPQDLKNQIPGFKIDNKPVIAGAGASGFSISPPEPPSLLTGSVFDNKPQTPSQAAAAGGFNGLTDAQAGSLSTTGSTLTLPQLNPVFGEPIDPRGKKLSAGERTQAGTDLITGLLDSDISRFKPSTAGLNFREGLKNETDLPDINVGGIREGGISSGYQAGKIETNGFAKQTPSSTRAGGNDPIVDALKALPQAVGLTFRQALDASFSG
jgi:hypothetical protein